MRKKNFLLVLLFVHDSHYIMKENNNDYCQLQTKEYPFVKFSSSYSNLQPITTFGTVT